ncbi:hypothetical protein DSO57_1004405 [Entomophthora muscae]|uniref:Uncharacterized protein n=1 Tax=Entomophthora muscae TaxID=34485 RepID=A0ACC2SXF1_9FUNG|nr:hypothetical protein DSO57_1004405 [Entomophthora muscae]
MLLLGGPDLGIHGSHPFVDIKRDLLNYVRPNRELLIALKSGIYGSRTVPELMCHLDYKCTPVPDSKPNFGDKYSPKKSLLAQSMLLTTTSTTSLSKASLDTYHEIVEKKTLNANSNNPSPPPASNPVVGSPPVEDTTLMDLDNCP